MSEPTGHWIVLAHPEDVNIADAKAMAADYDAEVVPNRFVQRGKVILTRSSVLEFAEAQTSSRPSPPAPNTCPECAQGRHGACTRGLAPCDCRDETHGGDE